MTTQSNQVHKKNNTKCPPFQARIPGRSKHKMNITKHSTSQLLTPKASPMLENREGSKIAPKEFELKIEDSANRLSREGIAASSLCVLNAYSIECAVNDDVEKMIRFNSQDFAHGNVELGRLLESNFGRCLTEWNKCLFSLMEGRESSLKVRYVMEGAVLALIHALNLQGEFLTNHSENDDDAAAAIDCCNVVADALRAAWNEARELFVQLRQYRKVNGSLEPLEQAA